MSLLSELVAELSPVIRDLAREFGATVSVSRAVVTKATDGTITRTYPAVDPTLVDIPAFLHAKSGTNREYGPTANARPYGVSTGDIGNIRLPALASTGALPILNAFDAITVTSGPLVGYTYLCDTHGQPDGAGSATVCEVSAAPAGKVL